MRPLHQLVTAAILISIPTFCLSQSVKIGSQEWTSMNLDVSTFQNGDPIPEAKTAEEWSKASFNGKPAWCYYNNDPANGKKYGRMYNFWAVNDKRGLAPKGWHVASDKEWADAVASLGGDSLALLKMSPAAQWIKNGNNASGFNSSPCGWRASDGAFFEAGQKGVWWTSSQCGPTIQAVNYIMDSRKTVITSQLNSKGWGAYVRCIKGELSGSEDIYICKSVLVSSAKPAPITSSVAPVINTKPELLTETVKIANREWALKNLSVKTFRNGDSIPQAKSNEEWKAASLAGKPAWCYLDNKAENGEKYGIIYNWYAVNDPRGLAPAGWYIPYKTAWDETIKALGGDSLAVLKIKATSGWTENGTDEAHFSALPGGRRHQEGKFFLVGTSTGWWTTSEENGGAYSISFSNSSSGISRSTINKGGGMYVRCIKK